MKTKKDAILQYGITIDVLRGTGFGELAMCDFIMGINFAQKWTPIEKELPPIGIKVIAKYKDYEKEDYVFIVYFGSEDELSFITHWRQVEIL